LELRPRSNVIVNSDGVIFDEEQQRIFQIDPVAETIWQALFCHGLSVTELISQLVKEIRYSREEARIYVAECLRQWEVAGFTAPPGADAEKPKLGGPHQWNAVDHSDDVFRVAGILIGVSYPDAASVDAVRAVMGHLRIADAVAPDFAITVELNGGEYRLKSPAGHQCGLRDADAVAVCLKQEVLEAILPARRDAIALHAAALLSPRGAVLLAGSSGSGKSTLAAMLNARGWPSVADDVVLLNTADLRIEGLALAYAAKPGSWPVLQTAFPEIDRLASHQRPDGRIVKYLPPRAVADEPGGAQVASVIFPNYTPGLPVTMRTCDKVIALVSLLREARNASQYLTCSSFLQLSELLSRVPVLSVGFGDAEDAAEAISQAVK
jgi:hypothetical protein